MRNGLLCLASVCGLVGCASSPAVDANDSARRAYLGLDKSIGKQLQLGFDGFNAATGTSLAPQISVGDTTGTVTITGQLDQGTSANKGMRLSIAMTSYSDGKITYNTSPDPALQPSLNLTLRGIPNGTLTGTLTGSYMMSGELKGTVTLNLNFAGSLTAGPNTSVLRAAGTTTVSGTATDGNGTYDINVMI